MRNIVAVAITVALAAGCGSSSSSSSGPQRPTGSVTGTLGGQAFTLAQAAAISAGSGSTPCSLGALSIAARAVEVNLTTASGEALACGELATGQCLTRPSARKATVVVAAVNMGATATEPTLGAGTYKVAADITGATPSSTGTYQLAYAEALAVDPSCAGTPVKSTGGLVWLDAPTTSRITGAVSITFADGSSISGNFDAPVCTTAPNVCQTATALAGAGLCPGPVSCP